MDKYEKVRGNLTKRLLKKSESIMIVSKGVSIIKEIYKDENALPIIKN